MNARPLTGIQVPNRETREGWAPADYVETEVNGGLKEDKQKGFYLGCFVGVLLPVQEILFLPWLL